MIMESDGDEACGCGCLGCLGIVCLAWIGPYIAAGFGYYVEIIMLPAVLTVGLGAAAYGLVIALNCLVKSILAVWGKKERP